MLKACIEISHGNLHGVDNSHGTFAVEIEILSDAMLKELEADNILISISCDRHKIAEIVDTIRCVTSSAHSLNGKKSRIIPSVNMIAEH